MKRKPFDTPHSVHKLTRTLTPQPWTRSWFEQMIMEHVGSKNLLTWDIKTIHSYDHDEVIICLTFWPYVVEIFYLVEVLKIACRPFKPSQAILVIVPERAPTS